MSLERETWKNLGWAGTLQAFSSILQTGTNIVLARILFPEDFGIIALAQTFIVFVQRFQDFGLGTAVVQKKGDVRELIHTANTFRAILSALLVAACFGLGPFWADFYGEAAIARVIRVLSLTFVLNAAVFVPRTFLRRRMAFKEIFIAESVGAIGNSVVKVAAAVAGAGYWAIPAGAITGQAIATVLTHLLCRQPFRFGWSGEAVTHLYRFTRFLVLAGFITFVSRHLDRMTVGKALGLAWLGYFDIALRWGTWLTIQLTRVIKRVFLPTLSRIQDDLPRLKRGLLKSTELLSAVSTPAFVGLAVVAPDFVATLLGDRWAPSATALAICTACGLFRCQREIPATLLVSVGMVRIQAVSSGVTLVVTAVLILPATLYLGIEGTAAAVSLAALAGYLTLLPALFRTLSMGVGEYLRALGASTGASAGMAAAVLAVRALLADWAPAARLLTLSLLGAVVYTALLCLFSRRGIRGWIEHLRPWRKGAGS